MKFQRSGENLRNLLTLTLLLAGCGDSGSSAISQLSLPSAPASRKAEAEIPAERGTETTLGAANLGRLQSVNGDVTMERSMAQRRYLVFHTSEALDAINDTNGISDIYLRDLQTRTVTLVSKTALGQAGNGPSTYATISSDGKRIAYQSLASNLVASDSNSKSDVFLHDREAGTTVRVSLNASNVEGNDDSSFPALNFDGSLVAFVSKADLTRVGTGGIQNLFLRKMNGSATRLLSPGTGTGANDHVYNPVMTNDSRYIAYSSAASNLVTGDSNGFSDIFLYDRSTGLTERITLDSAGQQTNGQSAMPSISDNGNLIAFESKASNLISGDSNGLRDLFVRNRLARTTTRVSVDANGAQPNGISYHATLTRDGSRVAFASQANNLVFGDTNNVADVFHRLVADPTSIGRAGRYSLGDLQGDGPSDLPSFDSDENILAFRSNSATTPQPVNTVNKIEVVYLLWPLENLFGCKASLRLLAAYCEQYSTDHAGRYPSSLSQLVPTYAASLPTCPATGKDTYSTSYQSTRTPDGFALACAGHNHGALRFAQDYPQYSSALGYQTPAGIVLPDNAPGNAPLYLLNPQERVAVCRSNLATIGTFVRFYFQDNAGRYPSSLSQLPPSYLPAIPTCPGAGYDSYSSSYVVGTGNSGYSVYCSGIHHADVSFPANFPQYSSTQRLILP